VCNVTEDKSIKLLIYCVDEDYERMNGLINSVVIYSNTKPIYNIQSSECNKVMDMILNLKISTQK